MAMLNNNSKKNNDFKTVYMGDEPHKATDEKVSPKFRHIKLGKKGCIGIGIAAVLLCVICVTAVIMSKRPDVYAVNNSIADDGYIHVLEIVPDYMCDELSLSINDPEGLLSWEKFINTCPKGKQNEEAIKSFIRDDLNKYVEQQRKTLDYKAPYIFCYNGSTGKFYSGINGLRPDDIINDLDSLGYDLTNIKIGLFDENSTPIEEGKNLKNHFGYQVFGMNDDLVEYDDDGNVKMKLIVKLAGDVTTDDIDDADLVYLNGINHAGYSTSDFYQIYNRIYPDNAIDTSKQIDSWRTGKENDLDAKTAFYLYREYTVGKIVLYNSTDLNGGDTNVQRICALMASIDPETFINEWAKESNDDGSFSGSRGNVVFEDRNDKGYDLINISYIDQYGNKQYMQFGSSMFAWDNTLPQEMKDKYPYYSWPSSGQFVTPNCYVFNGDTSTTRKFSEEFIVEKDYKDDGSYRGTSFSEARKYNNLTEDDKMSPKQVIRYLFNGMLNEASDLHVLEIEPCRDFKYLYDSSDDKATKEKALRNIRTLANYYKFSPYTKLTTTDAYEAYINNESSKKITFDCVTTAEFNGMNDDLIAKYDLIVIASQDGLLNKDENGRTIYNDQSLDGYIYLAYGDLIKTTTALSGYNAEDYLCVDSFYLEGGVTKTSPDGFASTIALGSDNMKIFSKNSTNTTGQSVWNPSVFSKLASLNGNYFILKNVGNSVKNINNINEYYNEALGNARFSDNDITAKQQAKLQEFIEAKKPILFDEGVSPCVAANKSRVYPTAHLADFVNENIANEYSVDEADAKSGVLKSMTLNRIVINSCNVTYDDNGTIKSVPACSYDSSTDLISNDCILNNITSLNYSINFSSQVGHSYTISMIVDKNADGLYSDEIKSDDLNEVYYRENITAPDAVSTTYNFTTPIPVGYNGLLAWRIVITDNDTGARQIKDGQFVLLGEAKNVNVLQIVPDDSANCTLNMAENEKFKRLLKDATDLINYNVSVKSMTASEFEKLFEKNPYKKTIDYDNDNNYIKVNNISMIVIGFGDLYCGDDISNDYGAVDCISDYIDHGKAVLFAHDTLGYANGVNNRFVANENQKSVYKPNQAYIENGRVWAMDITSKLRSTFGMDRYNVTQNENINVPKDANGNDVKEIQGFNNYILYRYAQNTTFTSSRQNGIYTLPMTNTFSTYYNSLGTNPNFLTTSVENTNIGQVTMFPYNTTDSDGKLAVAQTHGQYYQLDMEDPNLVVWYTLSGDKGTYYGDSAKDAGNNYYIYSKENITYTGSGHQSMTDNEAELKLYVNTIIKTVMAGNFVPEVKVTNGFETSADNTYVIHPLIGDDNIEVKYVANDKDLLPEIGKFKKGGVYWIDDSDPKNVKEVLLEEFTEDNPVINASERTFTVANDSQCYKYFKENNKLKIKIIVYDYYNESGSCIAEIVPRDLFDLE